MRTRSPSRLIAMLCVVACLVIPTMAGPAAAVTPDASLRVEVLDTETSGLDRAITLVGAPHRVAVTVAITNLGDRTRRDVVVRVEASASAASSEPVDLSAGETVALTLPVEVAGLPGATHDIEVSVGEATASTTHRAVPWLLIAAAAIGLHVAALSVRDRLRRRLARSMGGVRPQPSPNQTWARSSR